MADKQEEKRSGEEVAVQCFNVHVDQPLQLWPAEATGNTHWSVAWVAPAGVSCYRTRQERLHHYSVFRRGLPFPLTTRSPSCISPYPTSSRFPTESNSIGAAVMVCDCSEHAPASVFHPRASLLCPSFSKSVSAAVIPIVSSLHTLSLLQPPPTSARFQRDNHGAQASPTAVFVSH